jgi:hypothetical protein
LKVFFDEAVPRKLARSPPLHEPNRRRHGMGRRQNAALLKLTAREGFHVFLTGALAGFAKSWRLTMLAALAFRNTTGARFRV